MQYHILYLTINLINGKYYIGKHTQYGNPWKFDGYLGSGSYLIKAISKHGKQNFVRETILVSNDVDFIYSVENLVVNELRITDPLCYNMIEGGGNGWEHVNASGLSKTSDKNFLKQKETLLNKYGVDNPGKLWNSRKKVIERNKCPKLIETRTKQSETLKLSGKVAGSNNGMFGKTGINAPAYGRTGNKHPMFGKPHPKRGLPGKKFPKITCDVCGKIGGSNRMQKHIMRCKQTIGE